MKHSKQIGITCHVVGGSRVNDPFVGRGDENVLGLPNLMSIVMEVDADFKYS